MKDIKITDELIGILGNDLGFSTIDDVIAGNASKESIQYFAFEAASKIHKNKPLSEKLKYFIVDTLLKISRGDDPSKAFLIKHGSRRKKDNGIERLIAFRVMVGIYRDGMQVLNAISHVAEEFSKSNESIKQTYYKNKDYLEERIIAAINMQHTPTKLL